MATATTFDLTLAIQRWREKLLQSPHFKTENVAELESHIRDSVVTLQSKGLTSEESFLIATRRVGSFGRLESEFAKVNPNPKAFIIHVLILSYFTLGCWLLWGTLRVARVVTFRLQQPPPPAFTQLFLSLMPFWYVLPIFAGSYCGIVWTRKSGNSNSWFGFFAVTTAVLLLVTLPTLIAAGLPIIDFLNRQGIVWK
jgi:hypothetical protein